MGLRVLYDPGTGEIHFPLAPGDLICAVPITREQFEAGITLERRRHGGKPSAFRLADDSIVEEIWPPTLHGDEGVEW